MPVLHGRTSFANAAVTLIEHRLPPHGVLALRVIDRKERIAIDLPSKPRTLHTEDKPMTSSDLENVAQTLVAEGKGILAADETTPTLTKRFNALGIRSTEESRRTYREMLFTSPGAAEFISGAIMYDETIRQNSSSGAPLAEALIAKEIVAGIKVDTGAKSLAGFPDETVTEGLDGLRDRLREYHGMSARFAKWRR